MYFIILYMILLIFILIIIVFIYLKFYFKFFKFGNVEVSFNIYEYIILILFIVFVDLREKLFVLINNIDCWLL